MNITNKKLYRRRKIKKRKSSKKNLKSSKHYQPKKRRMILCILTNFLVIWSEKQVWNHYRVLFALLLIVVLRKIWQILSRDHLPDRFLSCTLRTANWRSPSNCMSPTSTQFWSNTWVNTITNNGRWFLISDCLWIWRNFSKPTLCTWVLMLMMSYNKSVRMKYMSLVV